MRAIKSRSDLPFILLLSVLGGSYVVLILAMIYADLSYTSLEHIRKALATPEILFSIKLSFFSCTVTAILSVIVAVPLGYLISRYRFPGRRIIDAFLDIPIILPALVIGLSLLILFRTAPGQWIEQYIPFTYAIPGVILAQFAAAAAFAVRTMIVDFDQIKPRCEQVALTLGCSQFDAFWRVALPQAYRGMMVAGMLAWARALGEFGPILVFAGATRNRTEVLSSTIFLELSIGNIEAAVAVSVLLIIIALTALTLVRVLGIYHLGKEKS